MGFLNIFGGMITLIALMETNRRYIVAPRMLFYIFLCVVSMFFLIFTQVNALTWEGDWRLKLGSLFWWAHTLYFAWAIRFSSLKK